MKTVLITGANGFIGRQICISLAQAGYHVSAAVRSVEAKSALAAMQVPLGAVHILGDLSAETDWTEALKGVETVIHTAGRAHNVKESAGNETLYDEVNHLATRHLAEQACAAGVKHFIFFSTIAVLGTPSFQTSDQTTQGYHEGVSPAPNTPYERSKYAAELALHALSDRLTVTILRPALVYGPAPKGNFRRLMRLVERGLPLPLGRVRNNRHFLYMGNLIAALTKLLETPSAWGECYHLSDTEALSTPDLIRALGACMGTPVRLFPFPIALLKWAGKLTGMHSAIERLTGSLVIDHRKLCQAMDWTPPFTVSEGLQKTAKSGALRET